MGEEGDDNSTEEQRVEKKYCCGNCPQREAINIARIDLSMMMWLLSLSVSMTHLGVSIYSIVIILTLSVIYFVVPDYFPNYVKKNPQQRFLTEFLALSSPMKYTFLSLHLIFPVFSLLLAILLLIGAKAKNVNTLARWFKLSIMKTIPALAVDIYTVATFFEDKMTFVSFVTFYYLYRLYSLWIVVELNKEIKHVDTDFVHPMYRDNP